MTGPEHYRKAEEIAETLRTGKATSATDLARYAAEGQIHATLALAAATALAAERHNNGNASFAAMSREEFDAWQDAAGTKP